MNAIPLQLRVDVSHDGATMRSHSFVAGRRRIIKIGRRLNCDLCLNDRGVSRMHAAIDLSAAGAVLMDLGSSGGCLVNGERLAKATLEDGDCIRIADTLLVVHLGAAVAAPPPAARSSQDTSTGGVRAELVRQLAAAPADLVLELQRWVAGRRPQAVVAAPSRAPAPMPAPLPPPPPAEVEAALAAAIDQSAVSPLVEKYNTLRLVAQMRRERRRSRFGTAGIAVLLAFGMSYLVANGHAGVATRNTAGFIAEMTSTAATGAPQSETVAAQPEAEAEAEPEPAIQTHVVQRGETLSSIAAANLGDYRRAAALFEANRDVIADPERIEVGMELRLPPR